jgi:hypothetical protein
MSNVKISQLTSGTTLTGSEEIPIVQSGSTVKTTTQEIANLVGSNPPLEILKDGILGSNTITSTNNTLGFIYPVSGNQTVDIFTFTQLSVGNTCNSTYLTFPTLTSASLQITNVSTLTSISFPSLTNILYYMMNAFNINSNPLLTTITIPTITYLHSGVSIFLNDNALTQSCVDDLLVKFAATNAINNTLYLDGGTNSTPSAIGLAAKTTLEGNGWTVNIN